MPSELQNKQIEEEKTKIIELIQFCYDQSICLNFGVFEKNYIEEKGGNFQECIKELFGWDISNDIEKFTKGIFLQDLENKVKNFVENHRDTIPSEELIKTLEGIRTNLAHLPQAINYMYTELLKEKNNGELGAYSPLRSILSEINTALSTNPHELSQIQSQNFKAKPRVV